MNQLHPRLPEVLAGPHRFLSRIEARSGVTSIVAPYVVPFTRWQLTFDETRAPFAELKVDMPTPTDLGVLQYLDPRSPIRVRLWAGHRIDGVSDRCLLANLGLRLNSSTDPEGLTVLTAAGDEARVIDASPKAGSASAANAATLMENVITTECPGAVVNILPGTPGGPAVSFPEPTWRDQWQTIESLADNLGAQVDVRDDGLGVWSIGPRPQLASEPVWTFSAGRGGARISQASTLDRERWANRVYVWHEWTTATGETTWVRSSRSVTTGPRAATAGNIRAVEVKRTTPIAQAQCDAEAADLVERYSSRGRAFTIRHVAIPWLRPGMTVGVESAPGLVARHLVSSVMIDSSGWGETTTRYPDGETIGA